jgi:nitrate reductase beta subunit
MLNCSNIKKENQSDKYLDFFYFKGNKLFPFRINCKSIRSEMFKEDIKFKKVEDEEYFERFIKEYGKLKTDKEQSDIDTRIQIIFHNDKTVDTICMGSHFGIKINGVRKKDSKSFLNLVQEKMYD